MISINLPTFTILQAHRGAHTGDNHRRTDLFPALHPPPVWPWAIAWPPPTRLEPRRGLSASPRRRSRTILRSPKWNTHRDARASRSRLPHRPPLRPYAPHRPHPCWWSRRRSRRRSACAWAGHWRPLAPPTARSGPYRRLATRLGGGAAAAAHTAGMRGRRMSVVGSMGERLAQRGGGGAGSISVAWPRSRRYSTLAGQAGQMSAPWGEHFEGRRRGRRRCPLWQQRGRGGRASSRCRWSPSRAAWRRLRGRRVHTDRSDEGQKWHGWAPSSSPGGGGAPCQVPPSTLPEGHPPGSRTPPPPASLGDARHRSGGFE